MGVVVDAPPRRWISGAGDSDGGGATREQRRRAGPRRGRLRGERLGAQLRACPPGPSTDRAPRRTGSRARDGVAGAWPSKSARPFNDASPASVCDATSKTRRRPGDAPSARYRVAPSGVSANPVLPAPSSTAKVRTMDSVPRSMASSFPLWNAVSHSQPAEDGFAAGATAAGGSITGARVAQAVTRRARAVRSRRMHGGDERLANVLTGARGEWRHAGSHRRK